MPTKEETLSRSDFERLRELIYREAGINLSVEKKTMVEIRVRRRLRNLGCQGFADYCRFLFTEQGFQDELVNLIDVITTNKTDFFREPGHFEFLVQRGLPELARRFGSARQCQCWSAGCSTGEEPYTLAMVLSEYARNVSGFRFGILATDISTEVLEKAAMGIFKGEVVRPVPIDLRRRYFMRSKDPQSERLRVVPELRSLIEFRRLNFMDGDFGISEPMEFIFCRNVIIYFDRATQVSILRKLTNHLIPGGYFFAGHSESLQGMDLPLVPLAPSVYRKV
jgi:chemotaxis protein methyltransferase CheR